jgi:uncharacterized protein
MTIGRELLERIRQEFALPWEGVHGVRHWERVSENGLRLAEQTGADCRIVELFAYLHDVRRQNDGWDLDHGARSAEFVRSLCGTQLRLPDDKLEVLVYACAHHSEGLTDGDLTVQTCWDADRLDLGRIGIRPDPRYLCTEKAKAPAMIEWAYQRSRQVIYCVD